MSIVYTGIFSDKGCIIQCSIDMKINPIIDSLIRSLDLEVDSMRSFGPHEKSYNYAIQAKIVDRHIYISACTADLDRRVVFNFLDDIIGKNNNIKELEGYILREMRTAPNNPKYNPLGTLQEKIKDTKTVISNNIDMILQRGDSLIEIADKSERLSNNSVIFNKSTKKLKCAMIKNNIKLLLIILFSLVLFLGFIGFILFILIKWF